MRGRIYSCIGELCWYLAASNKVEDIFYYIPRYAEEDENGIVHGGYGPRLFSWDGVNQIDNVVRLLKDKPSSRRGVIQLFDRQDLTEVHKDIPCTCSLQFLIRDSKLQLITYMRSNDAYMGLPHDIFCFTMIQELVAATLGVELGSYFHFVGSLHLYASNEASAKAFLREGWQSSVSMPPMPHGDPWEEVRRLLATEKAIRQGDLSDFSELPTTAYWADISRLLTVLAASKRGDVNAIRAIKSHMDNAVFNVYIDPRLDRE